MHNARAQREEYLDFLYAFFQNCWHLKDWIRHDRTAPQSLKDAANRIRKRQEQITSIDLAVDLANRTKHLELKQTPRRDGQFIRNLNPYATPRSTCWRTKSSKTRFLPRLVPISI